MHKYKVGNKEYDITKYVITVERDVNKEYVTDISSENITGTVLEGFSSNGTAIVNFQSNELGMSNTKQVEQTLLKIHILFKELFELVEEYNNEEGEIK